MLPSSESRPTPGTNVPVRTDRMNRLESSSGIVATLAQNWPQIPSWPQILLDVRQVERGDDRAAVADVGPDRAQCLRPAEVADDRHEQVLRLQFLQEREVLLAGEEAARVTGAVVGHHEIGERRRRAAAAPAARRSTRYLMDGPYQKN